MRPAMRASWHRPCRRSRGTATSRRIACTWTRSSTTSSTRCTSDTRPNVFLQRPKPDETLPLVHGDPQEIEKLVRALVKNASESFGEEGGKVVITTGTADVSAADLEKAYLGKGMSPGSYVFLEVADNGSGIDEDIRSKVFVPFFTTKPEHNGLGLAAVLGIMRAHRGALTLESAPQQGSVVRALFPMA